MRDMGGRGYEDVAGYRVRKVIEGNCVFGGRGRRAYFNMSYGSDLSSENIHSSTDSS